MQSLGVRCCTFGLELVAEHHTTLRIFLRFQVMVGTWKVCDLPGSKLSSFSSILRIAHKSQGFNQRHWNQTLVQLSPTAESAVQVRSKALLGDGWRSQGPGPPGGRFFLEPKPSLIIQYPTLRHTRISFALSMEISIISHNYPDLDHFCCSTLFKHPVMMFFFDPASLTQARWQAEGRGSARK
jgi:hypothetical protein